eukprot:s1380_g3.t1
MFAVSRGFDLGTLTPVESTLRERAAVWCLDPWETELTIKGIPSPASFIAASADGHWLATAALGDALSVFGLGKPDLLAAASAGGPTITAAAFAPEDELLALGCSDGSLQACTLLPTLCLESSAAMPPGSGDVARMQTKEMGDGAAVNRLYEGAICIVLAAGFSKVEQELEDATDASDLAGLPKALLPVAGKPMLDHWNRLISDIFLVSNALKYKHFERWATAKGIAVSRVVNSGATAMEKGRGVLRDVELGLRRAQQVLGAIDSRDVIVFAGDTLFFKDFDLQRILDFHFYKGGSLMLYYGRRDVDNPSERGMCEVDVQTSKVTSFVEKPPAGLRGSEFPFVSPLFYILEPAAWKRIPEFNSGLLLRSTSLTNVMEKNGFSFGRFVQHAIGDLRLPFWGMRMPGAFHLIGASTGLEEYRQLDQTFIKMGAGSDGKNPDRIRTKTYARVGLMGNPSDGFHGKTLSVTIRNFWASVEMWESPQLRLLPHPLFDPSSFSGLAESRLGFQPPSAHSLKGS